MNRLTQRGKINKEGERRKMGRHGRRDKEDIERDLNKQKEKGKKKEREG